MNIFLKQSRRKPIFTIFMIILLCLSLTLSLIGFSAYTSMQKQFNDINGDYTTIAVLQESIPEGTGNAFGENFLELAKREFEAFEKAQKAPMLKKEEARVYLTAHVPGSVSLSSSRIDPSELNQPYFDDDMYSLCVFAVECKSVEETVFLDMISYDAKLEVIEVISLSSAYDWYPEITEVSLSSMDYNADGSIPIKAGSKYLIYGSYGEYYTMPIIESFRDVESTDGKKMYSFGEGYMQLRGEFGTRTIEPAAALSDIGLYNGHRISGEKDGLTYYYSLEDQLPWIAEYTGTVDEFLESEEGKVWKEEIIPLCRKNQEGALVALTDNLDSIYPFSVGSSFILEGRKFNEKEYSGEKNVCLISSDYAMINGFEVGDKITLDLYSSGILGLESGARDNSAVYTGEQGGFMIRVPIRPKNSINLCKEFEIVGIYSTPRFSFGPTSFDADHIIIPKKSVPNAEQYLGTYYQDFTSFILENGTIDEFEQYMSEQGYPDMFIYNDQGFSEMEETLLALEANAKRMMTLGMSVFALITALFLFLNFRRMMPVIRGVRLLGKNAGRTRNEVFAVLFMEETISVIIGTVLAAVLYNSVTSAMLSETIALDFKNLLSAAAALLGILGILSFMLSGILSNVKLMKRK